MHTDVVIVGKGIAAMVLAFLLKQKGIDYLLLDRKGKPKHFDLAETLPPSALPLLQSLGLLKLFEKHSIRKTYGYHSLWGSDRRTDHNFYFNHPFKYGLKINKKKLLTQLEEITQSPTVSYEQSLKVELSKEGATISFDENGTAKNIDTKIIIDATGRSRAILKLLQIPNVERDATLSFSCHLPKKRHPNLKHDVFVESFKEGWGLVSGLSESQNVVSIFSHQKSSLFKKISTYQNWKTILQETKYLHYFLADDPSIKVTGRLSNSSRPEQLSGDCWLAIGDAALAFDPLCSHGISNAIYTTLKASEAIEEKLNSEGISNAFSSYQATLLEIFKAYLTAKEKTYRQETRWSSDAYWSEMI